MEISWILETSNVASGYGKVTIVEDATIRVGEGEIVTIVGPNGSGKSTLLKSIVGVVRVFRGNVFYRNMEITGVSLDRLVRDGISYVPQIDNVFTKLTALENLEMGGFGTNGSDLVKEDIGSMLDLFPELRPLAEQKAGTLSGGERQMLAIARALMTKPHLLILDEPTANLAPKAISKIHTKIDEIRRNGVSVLMVEQNAKRALQITNRGYIMMSGRVVFAGSPQEILQKIEVEKIYFAPRPQTG